MRRISAKHAKLGMVLGRPIYDGQGYEIIEKGTKITEELQRQLNIYGIAELFVFDERVEDVPVQPLISPELEGMAMQALRTIITECQGTRLIDDMLLEEAEAPVLQMARELFPEVIGEANAAGCPLLKDYPFVQPAKSTGLSLLLGRRMGLKMLELAGLGMAALLKDIGAIALPKGILDKADPSEQELLAMQKHPVIGAEIVSQLDRFGPEVGEAIYYHHERWDGSGYPEGLKGNDIPLGSRIIAIADTYYEMVSKRPDRDAYMPHEAVEFIMAFSGDLFDPELVALFARQVPLYPTGITVQLNTGEGGIVSDSNLGYVGRPTVRICIDEKGRPLQAPFDLNLSLFENQGRMVVQVVDY